MLVSALVATLVGFGLLVVALVTGTLWLAVACIVVCVLGALLLVADTLGLGHPLAARASRLAAARRDRRASSVGDDPIGSLPADVESDTITDDATAITTEMPRVDPEPVPDLSADPETGVDEHHGRHETAEDDVLDTHAHVRRDGEVSTPAPWLTPRTVTHHARPDDDHPAVDPVHRDDAEPSASSPRRHHRSTDTD